MDNNMENDMETLGGPGRVKGSRLEGFGVAIYGIREVRSMVPNVGLQLWSWCRAEAHEP